MELEITEERVVKKTINIAFPYYYKHDLCSDYGKCVIYGKMLSPELEFTIQEGIYIGSKIEYQFELSEFASCYLKDEYKSCEKEYRDAEKRALIFLSKHLSDIKIEDKE